MKQPKAPTYLQKVKIAKAGLNWKEWAVIKEKDDELNLVNKKTGEQRTIGSETDDRRTSKGKGDLR